MTHLDYLNQTDHYGRPCDCCGGKNHPYMVQFELWKKVFPGVRDSRFVRNSSGQMEYVKGTGWMACIPCFEEKLGRPLVEEDFIDAPINYGIFGFDCRIYCSLRREAA